MSHTMSAVCARESLLAGSRCGRVSGKARISAAAAEEKRLASGETGHMISSRAAMSRCTRKSTRVLPASTFERMRAAWPSASRRKPEALPMLDPWLQ